MDIEHVLEMLSELSGDTSLPKNVRSVLIDLRKMFESNDKEMPSKIDEALRKIEDLTLDQNISSFARTQLWSLTSLLEEALKH